jgi:hypothetical protein
MKLHVCMATGRNVTHRVSDHKPESYTLSSDIHLRHFLMISTKRISENSNFGSKLRQLASREKKINLVIVKSSSLISL